MTSTHPKISIVTPNYNLGKYLEETILSVLGQNYPNLEYIIMDGGSTDNSVDIIKKYENRLSCWVSEPDKGLYDAVQKGFDRSTGEIMAWINSDDLYHPKSLFSVAEIFSNYPAIKWLQGAPTCFDESGRTVVTGMNRAWSKFDFYIGDYQFIQQESVFWRRSLWEKAGSSFNPDMKFAGDFDLWLRFFRYEKLYVTDALTGGFRVRTGEQMSLENFKAYIQEADERLKKEPISEETGKILRKYNRIKQIENFILNLGYLSPGFLTNKTKRKNFDYPPAIIFNRQIQQFETITSGKKI